MVDDRDRVVRADGDLDVIVVPREVLVDGVVDDLPDQVMQTGPVVGIADVHARPLPHRLEPFEHLDARLIVLAALGRSGRGGTGGRFFDHGLRERTRQARNGSRVRARRVASGTPARKA